MKIPKEKLGQFGISIRVNRKEKLRKLSSASWTQKGFCEGICSEPSLISMEKGKPGRFLDNYEMMAEKLGKRIVYAPEIDKKIENYTKHLYKGMEVSDLDKIEKYSSKCLELLREYNDTLWYGDFLNFLNALNAYYFDGIDIQSSDIENFIDMIGEFSVMVDDMIKSLIFNSIYQDVDNMLFENVFDRLKLEENNFICNQVNCLLYYFATEKIAKFIAKLINVEKFCIKHRNQNRLLDTYNMAVLFYSYYDKSELEEYIDKLENLMECFTLSDYKLADLYYCLGIANHELSKFERVIEYMKKCYKVDMNKTKLTFIFIASSQRKLNYEIEIPYYSDEELSRYPKDITLIYDYFVSSKNHTSAELEKIIMKRILPKLNFDDEIIIKIIRDELERITSQTTHYKNLIIFDNKTKQLLNNH